MCIGCPSFIVGEAGEVWKGSHYFPKITEEVWSEAGAVLQVPTRHQYSFLHHPSSQKPLVERLAFVSLCVVDLSCFCEQLFSSLEWDVASLFPVVS